HEVCFIHPSDLNVGLRVTRWPSRVCRIRRSRTSTGHCHRVTAGVALGLLELRAHVQHCSIGDVFLELRTTGEAFQRHALLNGLWAWQFALAAATQGERRHCPHKYSAF